MQSNDLPDMTERQVQRQRQLQGVADDAIMLHEIYASIQGESTYAGIPCTFVRTSMCHLRCTYCDTTSAFVPGQIVKITKILERVQGMSPQMVLITGGEPLLQPGVLVLMSRLADLGYRVLLETSGSLDIAMVDPRVIRIVDFKTPSSGEQAANCYDNIYALNAHDEIKFVLGSYDDYQWARKLMVDLQLSKRCQILMGPVWGALDAADLARWILQDQLPVRLQLQLHKYIWGADQQGV